MSKDRFVESARRILHNLALERKGVFRLRRWVVSDEPLRNDAANLLRECGMELSKPDEYQYVGDDTESYEDHGRKRANIL